MLTLAFAGCGLGLFAGVLLAGPPSLSPAFQPPPTAVAHVPATGAPGDPPMGVLLILLDRTVRPPQLQGAWLIYVLPGARHAYLQGLPYDLRCAPAGGTSMRLDEAYRAAGPDERRADQALRVMVQRVFASQNIDYLLVLDGTALDEAAGWLGPVSIGAAAPGTPPSAWWYDPTGSDPTLTRQQEILTGLLAALQHAPVDDVAGYLYASVTRTGRTDLPDEQFARFLRHLAAYGGDPTQHSFLRLDPQRQYCRP